MPRPALALALALAALVAAGCATGRRARAELEAAACRDGQYRGRFDAATEDDGRRSRSFRLSVRACAAEEALLLELRGAVGGAALLAALRPGADVRLIFPTKRRFVDGTDTPEFWHRWAGVALDGRVLAALARGGEAPQAPEGWNVNVVPAAGPGERLPDRLAATSPEGDRLQLDKTREAAAREALAWPEVPRGFTPAATGDDLAGEP